MDDDELRAQVLRRAETAASRQDLDAMEGITEDDVMTTAHARPEVVKESLCKPLILTPEYVFGRTAVVARIPSVVAFDSKRVARVLILVQQTAIIIVTVSTSPLNLVTHAFKPCKVSSKFWKRWRMEWKIDDASAHVGIWCSRCVAYKSKCCTIFGTGPFARLWTNTMWTCCR
jgi:hypothetical protein